MTPDYALAFAHVQALINADPDVTLIDLRFIHDTDKGVPAMPMRGLLRDLWPSVIDWNAAGYGIFVNIQAMDGNGLHLQNVAYVRTLVVDLDDLSIAAQSYSRAASWTPAPSFAVNTSPGKFHVYWPCVPFIGNDRYETIARKLILTFGGDKSVIDAARVLRLAGTVHGKNPAEPHLVTCHTLSGYGTLTNVEAIEAALGGVFIQESAGRRDLGDATLAAPSAAWARSALMQIDPNSLNRSEWITVLSAFKQSIWSHVATELEAFEAFSEWCSHYVCNDPAENLKQWNSIRNTEVGWTNLSRRSPQILAWLTLGDPTTRKPPAAYDAGMTVPPMPSTAAPVDPDEASYSAILTPEECRQWFKECFWITKFGKILEVGGRMMNQNQFNGIKGGKRFIIDAEGKTTDEPWKAALRSTLWNVPKVDHTRFLPHAETGAIVTDSLGRTGVNTYKAVSVRTQPGDPEPFLRHLRLLMPNAEDLRIYLDYIAHNVRFPGHKIAWAPVLVSAEGAGKGILKTIIQHAIGKERTYSPNAQELVASGSKFNKWMREKLFIIVDEIKVDERRELVEILKPMISDPEIEIQGKGEDQDMEDNYSNWQFHSNHKDAIPINKNGRRYAIIYLSAQSNEDLERLGMNEAYFRSFLDWVENQGGKEIAANYLMNYPIERGQISFRAPQTSSTLEAIEQSRSPLEQVLWESVERSRPGFIGGYVSTLAFKREAVAAGVQVRGVQALTRVLEATGYVKIGRGGRPYFAEDPRAETTLYGVTASLDAAQFGRVQGYE